MIFQISSAWQFFVTFLGWLSDPFKGLSDLQLGHEKVTLNHLVGDVFRPQKKSRHRICPSVLKNWWCLGFIGRWLENSC